VRRYNMIYPEKDNVLPISSAKDVDKCKDFDLDKVDLRYNNVPISNEKKPKNILNKMDDKKLIADCNV